MPDAGQLITAHGERLRKIVAKFKAGKSLSAEDLALLDPAAAAADAAAGVQQLSFDSLQAAASALGIPKHQLQHAKDAGAPGFRGSRIYPLELLPWLFTTPGGKASLRDKRVIQAEILEEELEDLRWEKAKKRGEWILKSEVNGWMVEAAEKIKSILRNRLKNQLPPKLVGLQAPEIAAKMDPVIAEIVDLFHEI